MMNIETTQTKIRDFVCEMGVVGKLQTARALEEQIADIEADLQERRTRWQINANPIAQELNKKSMLALIAYRKRLLREFNHAIAGMILTAAKSGTHECTREEIDRAETYPIDQLVEVGKGKMAHCISDSHVDKTPSMDCRNNFAYCYACGWSGGSIAVAMKIYKITFPEAVKKLQ